MAETAQEVARRLEVAMLGRASVRVEASELRALLAERRELLARQAPEWMPIETALKDGTPMLGFWAAGADEESGPWQFSVTIYASGAWHSVDDMGGQYAKPTHWMPLPPPPTLNTGIPKPDAA